MTLERKLPSEILTSVGFMLSPLSWWNAAFVNLPLAYTALIIALVKPGVLTPDQTYLDQS